MATTITDRIFGLEIARRAELVHQKLGGARGVQRSPS